MVDLSGLHEAVERRCGISRAILALGGLILMAIFIIPLAVSLRSDRAAVRQLNRFQEEYGWTRCDILSCVVGEYEPALGAVVQVNLTLQPVGWTNLSLPASLALSLSDAVVFCRLIDQPIGSIQLNRTKCYCYRPDPTRYCALSALPRPLRHETSVIIFGVMFGLTSLTTGFFLVLMGHEWYRNYQLDRRNGYLN